MSKIIEFAIKEIEPEKDIVFKENGYSPNKSIPDKILNLYEESLNIFLENSNPIGIYSEILKENFEKVFFGEGNNSAETPVEQIFPKADNLTLFAITIGRKVSEKIQQLFLKNDFALGHILDCIASLAADNAVRNMEELATKNIKNYEENIFNLAYSPGYCGWHISGQKKLFEYLHPEKIGITLNDSFLMIPLKSVSGVMIIGKREIHKFENNFSFCSLCKTKNCLERM